MVMIYHSASGKKAPYKLPLQRKIEDGAHVYRGSHNVGELEAHIIEVAENNPWSPNHLDGSAYSGNRAFETQRVD